MIPRHLYVHAPFCARRCSYCDFAVTVERSPAAAPWLAAVGAELDAHVRHEAWDRLRLATVYVGGGTPSLFGAGAMAGLGEALRRHADLDETVEWTAEANPEQFGQDLATDWLAAGVNRLSLGAQSFDESVLRWMGRMHGADGPGRAVRAARDAGFEDISLDLIFGLPARLERNWDEDLARIIDLGPEHVSLYGLTAEKGAPLGRWVEEGRETMAGEDAYADEYLRAAEVLVAAGYQHYEVSNFARPGRPSRHNGAYWSGAAYLGLGPGAHSYLPPSRFWNVRDWADYRRRVLDEPHVPGGARAHAAIEDEESIDDAKSSIEAAWLGLRTRDGAPVASAEQRRLAVAWSARGWARLDGETLRLTAEGWLLLDRLAVEYSAAG